MRAAVQHVAETAMQPRFPDSVIVLWIDGFIVDVSTVTAKASDFLRKATLRVGHEFPIALIPQRVPMSDRA
jgi:hypothetical protein